MQDCILGHEAPRRGEGHDVPNQSLRAPATPLILRAHKLLLFKKMRSIIKKRVGRTIPGFPPIQSYLLTSTILK
jgi:hypothetical protein